MVDDYDYEYRRRRPRRTTYEGSYRRPGQSEYFDPSADILAGIESIEKSIGERKKKVTEFENTAALENQKYQDALADTESMEDTGVVDSLQQNLSDKILELNRLKIASFEGDQTEYLKKSSELNRYIETLPVLMGLIDEEAKATKDARLNGTFNKEYLRSNNKKYLDFIDAINDGGKGVTFDTKNGNIIAKLNGKEVFNGNAYVKGKKEGFDLINYADGYQEQIDQADAQAYKGLESLVSKEVIKGIQSGNGDKIIDKKLENYKKARQKYKERLTSGEIAIPVNESTYQKYNPSFDGYENFGYGDDKNKTKQIVDTKNAIIEKMVEDRFPGGDFVLTEKITQPAKKEETKPSPELVTYTEILKPADKLKSLLQNPNQGTRSKELVTEENKMRFEALSKQEKEAKEALEKSLTERFKLQRFGTESTGKIIAGGEIAVNDNGELMYFPKYNRTKDGVTELVTIEDFNNGIPLQEDILFRFEKDLSKVIKSDAKLAKTVNPKNQAEFNKAYAELKPGQSMIVNGITYTKPKK